MAPRFSKGTFLGHLGVKMQPMTKHIDFSMVFKDF